MISVSFVLALVQHKKEEDVWSPAHRHALAEASQQLLSWEDKHPNPSPVCYGCEECLHEGLMCVYVCVHASVCMYVKGERDMWQHIRHR